MNLSRQDWERVMEKACEIANATRSEEDAMFGVHVEGMMSLLDELEAKYGPQFQILATRADYLEDYSERQSLYQQALDLAKKSHDTKEIEEIMDSIKQLDEEEKAEPDAGADGPKAGRDSA
jgi:hypothetical protein